MNLLSGEGREDVFVKKWASLKLDKINYFVIIRFMCVQYNSRKDV